MESAMKMIKGFAIVPPILGAIRIGKAVVKNERRLPQKDDAFTITTLVQDKNGWIAHRLHDVVLESNPPTRDGAAAKIRSIPVRVAYDDPALNLQAEYSVFDQATGRPLCAGDGEQARRRTANGIENVDCPGPEQCAYGKEKRCKLYGRLNVQIDGQEDDLGVFVFRTTSFNSVRTLAARMDYIRALTGGQIAGMPLSLRLRAKTTSNSYRSVVYFVDLAPRNGMPLTEAAKEMGAWRKGWADLGLDRAALEAAVREGLSKSAFVDSEEDAVDLLESFTETPRVAAGSRPANVDEDGVIHGGDEAAVTRPAATGLAGLRAVMEREAPQDELVGDGLQGWHMELVD